MKSTVLWRPKYSIKVPGSRGSMWSYNLMYCCEPKKDRTFDWSFFVIKPVKKTFKNPFLTAGTCACFLDLCVISFRLTPCHPPQTPQKILSSDFPPIIFNGTAIHRETKLIFSHFYSDTAKKVAPMVVSSARAVSRQGRLCGRMADLWHPHNNFVHQPKKLRDGRRNFDPRKIAFICSASINSWNVPKALGAATISAIFRSTFLIWQGFLMTVGSKERRNCSLLSLS